MISRIVGFGKRGLDLCCVALPKPNTARVHHKIVSLSTRDLSLSLSLVSHKTAEFDDLSLTKFACFKWAQHVHATCVYICD